MGLLNVTLLITQPEYGDQQKYIIRNIDGAGETPKTPVNYADLTAGEKTEHDDVESFCNALLPSGKTAERIIMQIDQSEHESEERLIIIYDDGGTEKFQIETYSSLTSLRKTKYDALKTQANNKVPA